MVSEQGEDSDAVKHDLVKEKLGFNLHVIRKFRVTGGKVLYAFKNQAFLKNHFLTFQVTFTLQCTVGKNKFARYSFPKKAAVNVPFKNPLVNSKKNQASTIHGSKETHKPRLKIVDDNDYFKN